MDIKITPPAVGILPETETGGGGDMIILTLLRSSVNNFLSVSINKRRPGLKNPSLFLFVLS